MAAGFYRGALAVALVGCMWLNLFSQPFPQQSASNPSSGHLPGDAQMVSTLLPNGVQQLVVFDPQQKTLAVYHVEPTTGKIQIKSVRQIRVDLSMIEFNATEPLPSEMQLLKP